MTKPDRRRRERSPLDGFSAPPGHRHARLESVLLEELGLLLRDEITDPALMDVSLRSVTLSADYHHARAQFALPESPPPGPLQVRRAQEALERAVGFLRSKLADSLDLKRVPSLKFVYAPGVPGDDDDKDAWWK